MIGTEIPGSDRLVPAYSAIQSRSARGSPGDVERLSVCPVQAQSYCLLWQTHPPTSVLSC